MGSVADGPGATRRSSGEEPAGGAKHVVEPPRDRRRSRSRQWCTATTTTGPRRRRRGRGAARPRPPGSAAPGPRRRSEPSGAGDAQHHGGGVDADDGRGSAGRGPAGRRRPARSRRRRRRRPARRPVSRMARSAAAATTDAERQRRRRGRRGRRTRGSRRGGWAPGRRLRGVDASWCPTLTVEPKFKSSGRDGGSPDDRRGGAAGRRGHLDGALLRAPRPAHRRRPPLGPAPLPARHAAPARVHRHAAGRRPRHSTTSTACSTPTSVAEWKAIAAPAPRGPRRRDRPAPASPRVPRRRPACAATTTPRPTARSWAWRSIAASPCRLGHLEADDDAPGPTSWNSPVGTPVGARGGAHHRHRSGRVMLTTEPTLRSEMWSILTTRGESSGRSRNTPTRRRLA